MTVMASWIAKLQSMYLTVGLLLALVHLQSTWLGGEADDSHIQSFVPGGVAASQAPRRALLQTKTNQKVRAVNLGGWLVLEGWMTPKLFKDYNLPADPDLLDGTRITLQSTSGTSAALFFSAEGGGGSVVSCNRTGARAWEIFKIWRVSPGVYQLRTDNNDFIEAVNNGGGIVEATAIIPREWETFKITRNPDIKKNVHIQAGNGNYFQAWNKNQVTADWLTTPPWGANGATFTMEIVGGLQGEYQLANAWGAGAAQAQTDFKNHRDTFIQESDFVWLQCNGINAVRIPVGWWIAYDPNPPAPYVNGSLQCLDNAFSRGNAHGIKIIIDLNAAPGSQNGEEHSGTRDGVAQWATNSTYRDQSIQVIDFLAKRYASNPGFLTIELLNEPFKSVVPDVTVVNDYYQRGYDIVRMYSATTYVTMCQIIGAIDDEIVSMANLLPDDRVCIDFHPYNSFNDSFKTLSIQQNIDYVYNQRRNLITRLNQTNAYAFVGEWTGFFDCNTSPSRQDYLNFATAEENVFGKATFGWAYWSYRNANERWSYETSANQGYIPPRPLN